MADLTKVVQGKDYKLSGSGVTITATTISLQSFKLPDGTTNITMTNFGDIGYAVLEPGTSREENISFTGVTQNGDGTATFTGATRGLKFVDPYDQDTALRKSHAGGTTLRISNTAPFYSQFIIRDNDETITGVYTFSAKPTFSAGADMGSAKITSVLTPTANTDGANKSYVDGVAIAGAPNANTTTKGIVEEATQAEVDARTQAGGTAAELFINPSNLRATKYTDYAADAGGTDAYAITIIPAIAAYSIGQVFQFKANTANTGACTLNVNTLGAIAIKKGVTSDLETGDILANQIVQVQYDGTNMQFQSLTSNTANFATKAQVQNGSLIFGADSVGTDTYVITLVPTPASLDVGMVVNFKPLVSNTGAATLNVNGLGAKNIVKNFNQALDNGDLQSAQVVSLVYDGTSFQMQSQLGNAPKYFVGNDTYSGVSGTQSITGVGFKPKGIIFHFVSTQGATNISFGSGSWGSTNGANRAVSSQTSAAPFYSQTSTTNCIYAGDFNAGNTYSATVTTTNQDGFDLSWSKAGTPFGVNFTYTCFA